MRHPGRLRQGTPTSATSQSVTRGVRLGRPPALSAEQVRRPLNAHIPGLGGGRQKPHVGPVVDQGG